MTYFEFISACANPVSILDEEDIQKIIQHIVEKCKKVEPTSSDAYLMITAIESLSELQIELTRSMHDATNRAHILEKIADVLISIYYLQAIFNFDLCDIQKAFTIKLKEQEMLINNNLF